MRETTRRWLSRLGLAGKLVAHVGWILGLALAVTIGSTYYLARGTVRDQLRLTEIARVERWAARNGAAIQAGDPWKIGDSLADVGRDPYVVYAGFFDRSGKAIAHVGDEQANTRSHRLDILVPVRRAAASPGGSPKGDERAPLPGTLSDPREAERAVPLSERFRRALEGSGEDPAALRGWIEITLATEPLDSLLSKIVWRVSFAAAACLAFGLFATWLLVRQVVAPIHVLKEHVEWISEGRLDEPFHLGPRPPDELGELSTSFSIMAGILRSRREELDAQIVERSRALHLARSEAEAAFRPAAIAHDLKTPLTGIKALAEIVGEDELDPAERRRYLESIRTEVDRMAQRIDDLTRPAADPILERSAPAQAGDPLIEEAMAAAAAAEEAAFSGAMAPQAPRRFIIASADEPLREILREILAGDGAEVLEAADAVSALRLARQASPDGLVLDLLMEGGEALTMLGDLREDSRTERIRVLALSVVRDGDRFQTGAFSFQPKPIDRERFLGAVRAAIPARAGATSPRGKVLVVDDDRYVAEAVAGLLSREGLDVSIAGGGEEALLAAREDRPDLIVLDLKMPGVDGVQVIRRLRAHPETRERPVILMTAHDIPRQDQTGWPGIPLTRESFVRGVRAALQEAGAR
ncbi:MAG: response regulator [Acidobacteria bacterium]|nr:response regulator [Acidobacteriota bacterium]